MLDHISIQCADLMASTAFNDASSRRSARAEFSSSDEVLAEHGCSVPTFHGSVADLAAMAGVFVSLIGPHLETDLPGCHLVALHTNGPGRSLIAGSGWDEHRTGSRSLVLTMC